MEKKRDMAWKVLNRKIVFQDTWVQLEASSCELPDGRIIEPFYIHRDPNFAVVVAVTKDQHLLTAIWQRIQSGRRSSIWMRWKMWRWSSWI